MGMCFRHMNLGCREWDDRFLPLLMQRQETTENMNSNAISRLAAPEKHNPSKGGGRSPAAGITECEPCQSGAQPYRSYIVPQVELAAQQERPNHHCGD